MRNWYARELQCIDKEDEQMPAQTELLHSCSLGVISVCTPHFLAANIKKDSSYLPRIVLEFAC